MTIRSPRSAPRWRVHVVLTALAAGLVLAGAPAGPARAQDKDLDRAVQTLKAVLEGGGWETVSGMMDTLPPGLGDDPVRVRAVAAAMNESRGSVTKDNAAHAKEVAGKFLALATTLHEAKAEDADAMAAAALARVFRGRLERDFGGTPDAADWTESAGLLEKSWNAKSADGGAAADAVAILREAAKLPGAAAADLVKRADALLEAAMTKHPDAGPMVRAWGVRQIERAKAALAVKKAEATAIVDATLKKLAPAATRATPDLDAATVWNELVSFHQQQKLGLKADFVTRTARIGTEMEFKVPVSRYFTVDEDGSEPWVHQLTADFERLRTLGFDRYDWTTAHSFGVTGFDSIGGDNLKGIASGVYFAAKSDFATTKVAREPSKGRLNGRIQALVWELAGVRRKEKDEQRERGWVFKSDKGHMQTFAIRLFEWRPGDLDPAMELVLDSMAELPRK